MVHVRKTLTDQCGAACLDGGLPSEAPSGGAVEFHEKNLFPRARVNHEKESKHGGERESVAQFEKGTRDSLLRSPCRQRTKKKGCRTIAGLQPSNLGALELSGSNKELTLTKGKASSAWSQISLRKGVRALRSTGEAHIEKSNRVD